MILNEDYFDDIEITDDDIESSEEYSANTTFEYDNPFEWFTNEINDKYSAVLYIPINTDNNYECKLQDNYNKWKQIVPYIQKRLYYIFTEYGVEYYSSGQVILEDMTIHYRNGYEGCKFNDFHDYKIISKSNIKTLNYRSWFVYMPFFFNFPKTQSYRVVCKLISSILKFLWEDKLSGYLERQELIITTQLYSQNNYYLQKKYKVNIDDIINIIHLALGIDIYTIKDKLYANNRELLCKIWKYFYPDLKYLRARHPKWVDETRDLIRDRVRL